MIQKIKSLIFLLINLFMAVKLKNAVTIKEKGLIFRPCSKRELRIIFDRYKIDTVNDLSLCKKLIFKLFNKKLVLVIEKNELIVSFAFFYFNFLDLKNGTIHLGHYSVDKNYRGNGLGKNILDYSINNYCSQKLKGISLRVSVKNKPSLKAINSFDFTIIKEYFDSQMNEIRYYGVLKCRTNKNTGNSVK